MNDKDKHREYEIVTVDLDEKLQGFIIKCEEQYQLQVDEYYKQLAEEKMISDERIPELKSEFSVIPFQEFVNKAAWQVMLYFYPDYYVKATEGELLYICEFISNYVPGINTFQEYEKKSVRWNRGQ